MDSPFERPQNPSPPPSSPSTPLDGAEFIFPSVSASVRQTSDSMSSDGYETDSQLGEDIPLSLTASSSMESLPTDEHPPFLLAVATNRFFGAYAGKHVTLPPNLGRFLIANRRFTLDQDDQDDTAKRLRTESPVESEDELPTDESTFIVTQNEEKEKSDDDDHYEF